MKGLPIDEKHEREEGRPHASVPRKCAPGGILVRRIIVTAFGSIVLYLFCFYVSAWSTNNQVIVCRFPGPTIEDRADSILRRNPLIG
jgi:hypothetical protein